jgi:hypothetical protein
MTVWSKEDNIEDVLRQIQRIDQDLERRDSAKRWIQPGGREFLNQGVADQREMHVCYWQWLSPS